MQLQYICNAFGLQQTYTLMLIIAFSKLILINACRKKPTLPQIVLVNYFIFLVNTKKLFGH